MKNRKIVNIDIYLNNVLMKDVIFFKLIFLFFLCMLSVRYNKMWYKDGERIW